MENGVPVGRSPPMIMRRLRLARPREWSFPPVPLRAAPGPPLIARAGQLRSQMVKYRPGLEARDRNRVINRPA